MKTFLRLLLTVLVCTIAHCVVAQSDPNNLDKIWSTAGRTVVKITVTGTNSEGVRIQPRYGTGIIVKPGVILTARHVVGKDADWKRDGGGNLLRVVEVSVLNDNFRETSIGSAGVRLIPELDVAVLTVNGEGYRTTDVASRRPGRFDQVVVLPWPPGKPQPRLRLVQLTTTDRADDGDVLTIYFTVVEGYSGTPVLNLAGELVGIVTNQKEADTSLAQPADLFKTYLPAGYATNAPSVDSVPAGTLSYTYNAVVGGSKCTGHWEKYANVWKEFVPVNAGNGCDYRPIEFSQIGEDSAWFYAYDPSRDLTARLPKASTGDLQWVLTKVEPAKAAAAKWNALYTLQREQGPPAQVPINVCMGNGGGDSCRGLGVVAYTCSEFRAIGGGGDATLAALNRRFCNAGPETAQKNVRHNYSRGGGECGWTSFTVTCR